MRYADLFLFLKVRTRVASASLRMHFIKSALTPCRRPPTSAGNGTLNAVKRAGRPA